MTDEEKKEYDEMMADLKNLGIEPLHTENEEGEEEEILINRFTSVASSEMTASMLRQRRPSTMWPRS